LPKRQAHILLGLEREISEEEDDENITNNNDNGDDIVSRLNKKEIETEFYCYETEEDQIINDENAVDIQGSGIITP